MYNTVFFIANKPLSKEFEVAENVKDVAMDGIADYFTDSQPIPSSFVGTEVLEDGYFRLTEEDIENHFKDRLKTTSRIALNCAKSYLSKPLSAIFARALRTALCRLNLSLTKHTKRISSATTILMIFPNVAR